MKDKFDKQIEIMRRSAAKILPSKKKSLKLLKKVTKFKPNKRE